MEPYKFDELKVKFEILLSNIEKARRIKPLTSIADQDVDEINDWIKRLEQPKFYIVFTGTFNAGKSTIINAFLGRLTLPFSNKPWTAKSTTISKAVGEKEGFTVVRKNGKQETYDQVDKLLDFVSNQSGNLADVERVDVFIKNLPFDSDIVLVDTPGFDVANEEHKRTTNEFLSKAHACVVCFDIGLIDSSDQNGLVQYLSANKALTSERRFWVINKWDTKSREQQSQGESSFYNLLNRNKLNDFPSKLFKISAGTFLAGELKESSNAGQKEKAFIEEINLEKYPFTDDIKRDFSRFRSEIIRFLNSSAKKDFYLKAEQDLLSKLKKLEEEFNALYIHDEDEETRIAKEKTRIRYEEGKRTFGLVEDLIGQYTGQFKSARRDADLWNDSYVAEVLEKIIPAVNHKVNMTNLDEGFEPDRLYNPAKIIGDLLNVLSSEDVFRLLNAHAQTVVYDKYTYALISEIKSVVGAWLPDEIYTLLEEIEDDKRLSIRVRGLTDAVYYTFTDTSNQKIIPLLAEEKLRDKNPDDYKAFFVPLITPYLQDVVKNVVGPRITLLFHNYFAEITKDIKSLLDKHEAKIFSNISDDYLHMSEKMQQFENERKSLDEIKKSIGDLKQK